MEVLDYDIIIPDMDETFEQGEEWVIVESGDGRKKIRFHNYDEIYEIPGLYEELFYKKLNCQTPEVLCGKPPPSNSNGVSLIN